MAAAESDLKPSVIVSDIDVVYRVYGASKKRAEPREISTISKMRRAITKRPATGVREVHAVKGASFVAYHGESIGIIGKNGSGKSTLLRAVAGLIPPSRGQVYIGGEASLLGVNAVLMRQLSGRRNVMIGAQALGLTVNEAEEKLDEIVEFSGIGDFIDLPMSAYSSGMAARLRFAISTAAVPDILMIDEALATGDAAFKARSSERIKEIRKSAGTVFLVSHSAGTVKDICDRALWMDDGYLIMDGPADEVVDAYTARYKKKPRKTSNGALKKAAPADKPKVAKSPVKKTDQ